MDSPAVFHLSEIRRQLEILGYRDVPDEKLREYKAELDALVSQRDDDDGNSSMASSYSTMSQGAGGGAGRLVRRKTARRLPNGGRAVIEESCHSSVIGEGDDYRRDVVGFSDEPHLHSRVPQSLLPQQQQSADEQQPPQPPTSAGGRRSRQVIRPTPRSIIEGLSFRRSDPVRRYHQYAALWAAQGPTPGETQHKALRWAVREHLAEAQVPAGPPPPQPPGRVGRGPPEDRAAALRDEIRRELASYGFK